MRPWIVFSEWWPVGDRVAQPPAETLGAPLQLYLGNSRFDPEMRECGRVYPVERTAKAPAPGEALELLTRGPTPEERQTGYFSSLPEGSRLRLQRLEAGTAVVLLELPPGMSLGGSCAVEAIRAQVEATLRQFPEVQRVVVQLAGHEEPFLNP